MASVIVMPRLSPTMEEGVLVKWTKKVGDKIAPGDTIAEVETDKANMDFPLEDDGVLLALLVKEGETVKLGAPVAILGEAGEDITALLAQTKSGAAAPAPAAAPVEKPAAAAAAAAPVAVEKPAAPAATLPAPKVALVPPEPATQPKRAGNGQSGRVKVSPLARKVAESKGVDLHSVAGSGPGGRIVKRDIESAAPSVRAPSPSPSREDQLVPASQMRKVIARRLVEAKQQIPHIYLTAEATVDRLLELRAEVNELGGPKISVNDLVVKALALALRRVPDANVSWTPEGILRHGRVDIGVAVSLPDGLITPVLRAADQKPLGTLATEMRALAERARAKKLKPEEFSGSTATISNLGMYGVKEFVAIINPPEAVILAVGASEKRAVVVEKNGRDKIVIAQRMTLTLSCDHRVVDGVLGAQLLAEIVKLLEKPIGLVL